MLFRFLKKLWFYFLTWIQFTLKFFEKSLGLMLNEFIILNVTLEFIITFTYASIDLYSF